MAGSKNYKVAFGIITILFFLWGFITVFVDFLVPRLKDVFELNYFEAGLVQFAFFGAYGMLAIPSGNILSKIGYQKGMVLGLVTMAIGCLLFFPASSLRVFPLFMLAYFVIAAGMTILQVSANPYVSALGPESSASSRLNLSQAFNSLGTAIAPTLGAIFILSDKVKSSDEIAELDSVARETYYASEASSVQTPFIVLGAIILLLAVFFFFTKLPNILEKSKASNKLFVLVVPQLILLVLLIGIALFFGSIPNINILAFLLTVIFFLGIWPYLLKKHDSEGYGAALGFPQLKWGVLGIFVYVGAEVAIGTFLVSYFIDMGLADVIRESSFMSSIVGEDTSSIDDKGIVAGFVTFYWLGAMVGRFIGAFLTRIFNPSKVLATFAIGAITMILISMATTGFVSMWAILAVGLFNSIMFPTIFTLGIQGLGDLKPQGSGILCTAIVGGAVIPPLYGLCTDGVGFKMAFLLVILCYGYIMWYGWSRRDAIQAS